MITNFTIQNFFIFYAAQARVGFNALIRIQIILALTIQLLYIYEVLLTQRFKQKDDR